MFTRAYLGICKFYIGQTVRSLLREDLILKDTITDQFVVIRASDAGLSYTEVVKPKSDGPR